MPLTYNVFHSPSRSGTTAVETMLVVTILGIVTAMGLPQMRTAMAKAGLRAARADVTTFTALARAAAVQRSCGSVLHLSGADARVWVTACPRYAPGSGTVDTLVPVDDLRSRYHTSLTATDDSVQFDPRGLRSEYRTTVVRLAGSGISNLDSIIINPLGKVVRP